MLVLWCILLVIGLVQLVRAAKLYYREEDDHYKEHLSYQLQIMVLWSMILIMQIQRLMGH